MFYGHSPEKLLVEGLINKNKNASKLRELKSDNELFIAYFLRVINILPCDLVSMYACYITLSIYFFDKVFISFAVFFLLFL